MSTYDFSAHRKWFRIPKDIQQLLLQNVFCVNCGETTIVDFELKDEKNGVLLEGSCKTCGGDVARLVEDDG
ncbi:hypothetical protein [Salibacterium aidingense]|uniref:hypothetical protein n=1 Tax=Salibacterium aidingense TaxID=384933 RepID=UPI003BC24A51